MGDKKAWCPTDKTGATDVSAQRECAFTKILSDVSVFRQVKPTSRVHATPSIRIRQQGIRLSLSRELPEFDVWRVETSPQIP